MEKTTKSDPAQGGAGIDLLEELSHVNNELADMHRELGKKNAELQELNDKLRLLNEEKNRFVGMAAHDIRKPLAVITNFSEVLLDETADTLEPEHAGYLAIIERTGRAALDVVNSFLDISKIEAGKLDIEPAACDLRQCLDQAIRFNAHAAQKKDIAVRIAGADEAALCVCDHLKIGQVLDNLLSNAIKFSPPGAPVDIGLEKSPDGITVSVRDYGQGIPQQEMERLFKPFGRASTKATAGETSTGLGLAISKKIVEAHGGMIWIESAEGKGAAFFFTIPEEGSAELWVGSEEFKVQGSKVQSEKQIP